MNSLPVFIFQSFFLHIFLFLKHWYVSSFYLFTKILSDLLEDLDRFFAIKITLFHLFSPLYQDYSFVGYILGPIFRSFLLLSGIIIYAILISIFTILFFFWCSLPAFIIYQSIFAR